MNFVYIKEIVSESGYWFLYKANDKGSMMIKSAGGSTREYWNPKYNLETIKNTITNMGRTYEILGEDDVFLEEL